MKCLYVYPLVCLSSVDCFFINTQLLLSFTALWHRGITSSGNTDQRSCPAVDAGPRSRGVGVGEEPVDLTQRDAASTVTHLEQTHTFTRSLKGIAQDF